ncbi:MAG: hypothetical protein ACI3W8_01615 [Oscillospiraceae bacterium]
MQSQMRYFGYVCPKCGKSVMEGRSVFALQAAAARVACPCGKSELRVELEGTRARLHVPCGVCGAEHQAECSAEQLLTGRGIGLACPDCRQLCCYVGEEGPVARALKELELLSQKEKGRDEEAPEAFSDNVIMYEVLSELREIASRQDGVTCACGSRRWRMEVGRASVDLICADCGTKLRIPAATDEDLDSLCCHMRLVIPGRKA